MAQIGSSWVQTSWTISSWAANTWASLGSGTSQGGTPTFFGRLLYHLMRRREK